MVKKSSNKNETKVICQNCGAEVIIPAHESVVVGKAIGKDSGLGTVVLPTVGGSAQTSVQDAIAQLMEVASSNPAVQNIVNIIINQIEDDGYLEVKGIVRRWLPSQCLSMVLSSAGFHQMLIWRGYDYGWTVLINELKKQVQLQADNDTVGFTDRNRWYNKKTAMCMASHYINELQHHVDKLPRHKHKRRDYVKLTCDWLNKGKGVHVKEIGQLFTPLSQAMTLIDNAKTSKDLFDAVVAFNKVRRQIRFRPRPSDAFLNSYKAAGAYYTMKDLILFENCRMKVDDNGSTDNNEGYMRNKKRSFIEKEESLAALEKKAQELVKEECGVMLYGFTMLGLLKDFLTYNKFDYKAVRENWMQQTEARRAAREANKQNRRTRK